MTYNLLRITALGWLCAAANLFAQSGPAIKPDAARLAQTLSGLDGPGWGIAADDLTSLLIAASEPGTVQLWEKEATLGARAGDAATHILKGPAGPLTALAWNGGPVFATAGIDQKILVRDLPDGAILHTLTAANLVRALAMSPNGKLLASGSDDNAVQLWEIVTGKPGAKLTGHSDWILSLAFHPEGKLLASAGYGGKVFLWDVIAGKKALEFAAQPPPAPKADPGPANAVFALSFSPDGKLLALGGADGQIHLVNTADGKIVRSLAGHASSVTSLAFHPGGKVLASSSKDRTVRLWNPDNGQAIKSLEGHAGWVQGVTFLHQGTRLASVGIDQTLKIWDLTAPK